MDHRALVLAGIALTIGAAPARADTRQAGSYEGPAVLAAGPVLMGDQLAWAAQVPPTGNDAEGGRSAGNNTVDGAARHRGRGPTRRGSRPRTRRCTRHRPPAAPPAAWPASRAWSTTANTSGARRWC